MPRTLKYLALTLLMTAGIPAAAAHATSVPLYAYAKNDGTAHIYKQQNAVPTGYHALPLAGYIDTTGPADRKLVRLGKAGQITYIDTASEQAALQAQGWSVVSVIGYLQAPGAPDTLPTYRLEHNGDVTLTGDYVEKNTLVGAGWTLTGTLAGLTQRRCVPFLANNTAAEVYPPNGVETFGFADGTWDHFRSIYSVPCDSANGVQIVTAPRRTGDYAGRFPINPDATPLGWGQRAMVTTSVTQQGGGQDPAHFDKRNSMEGVERWYGFSFLFGPDFHVQPTAPSNAGSVILMEWHQSSDMDVTNETPCNVPAFLTARVMPDGKVALRLRMSGGQPSVRPNSCGSYETEERIDFAPDIEPLRDAWQDFVVHAKWCYDDNCPVNGLFELWHNGVKVAEVHGPNMYNDERTGQQGGNYRPQKWTVPSELFMGDWKQGNSYEDVSP